MHDRSAAVRGAANTAASWVRARRAAWTDAEATLARIAAETAPVDEEEDEDQSVPDAVAEAPVETVRPVERGWSVGRLIGRLRPGQAKD